MFSLPVQCWTGVHWDVAQILAPMQQRSLAGFGIFVLTGYIQCTCTTICSTQWHTGSCASTTIVSGWVDAYNNIWIGSAEFCKLPRTIYKVEIVPKFAVVVVMMTMTGKIIFPKGVQKHLFSISCSKSLAPIKRTFVLLKALPQETPETKGWRKHS